MQDLNFDQYWDNSENHFYDSKIIISILEDIMGKSLATIKEEIHAKQVVVTEEEIKKYLDKKFSEEAPELKKKIEGARPRRSHNITEWTEQDIQNASQEFKDAIYATRYCFDPGTLEYFNQYTTIVRNKADLLLNLIEKIGNKESQMIQEKLTDLDIVLDEKGNILKQDIIRLIIPTVYNVNELNEKINQANDLSTYSTPIVPKYALYRDGFMLKYVYPSSSIYVKDLYYDNVLGNVPLSENHRNMLQEDQSIVAEKFYKRLNHL